MNDQTMPAGDRYCVLDTETNDLPKYGLPADHPDNPRLAELALILLDAEMNVVEEYQAYVKPDGWSMKPGATAVNGLTDEFLAANGKQIGEVLAVWAQAVKEGYLFVAHSSQHDLKVMRGELRRAGMPDLFEATRGTCTMRSAMGHVVKESGKGGWPKLSDCVKHLGVEVEGEEHGALVDARRCLGVFRKLREMGVMQPAEVHRSKNKEAIEAAGRGETVPAAAKPKRAPRSRALPVSGDDEIPE